MPFSLYVFDLDGTIVDAAPDIAAALNRALADRGLPPLSVTQVRSFVGDGVVVLASRALAAQGAAGASLPEEAMALAAGVQRHYAQHPCEGSRVYDGIGDVLVALRARGARTAVLTNKPGAIARALLDAVGLAPLFDAVVGDGDGPARKPDPRGLLALKARFGAADGAVVMVGDGLPDIRVAHAAACPVAAVTWGYTAAPSLAAEAPTWLVEGPVDLLGLTSATPLASP